MILSKNYAREHGGAWFVSALFNSIGLIRGKRRRDETDEGANY